MLIKTKLVCLLVNLLSIFDGISCQKVIGCGGYIKSQTKIDYSKVQVKLYTKSGSLKDQTECAPNGYYFLPVYDKGEHILKVEPPRGWSFEPTEISLNIDGSTDDCSLEKDINFLFKGFGITGKVISEGCNDGPANILVSLYKIPDKKTAIRETKTSNGGLFSFTPIEPGKYILKASHSNWLFSKNELEITIVEGNTILPDNSLIVFGYDVTGKITSENEAVSDVLFILLGNGKAKNCDNSPIKNLNNLNNYICHVKSDKTGKFYFPAITNGQYKLLAHYADIKTKFDVQPKEITFNVNHNSILLSQDFKVVGFTVTGKINFLNGEPIVNAKIFISGKEVATTDNNGHYTIDKMKTGQYNIKIKADDVLFDSKVIKISPSSPELPVFQPSSYKVCGTVTLSNSTNKQTNHKVIIKNHSGTFEKIVETDPNNGQYCEYLISDDYKFNVVVTAQEKSKGIQFFPLEHNIKISSMPVKDINFLQLKATLVGTIECLKNSNCNQVSITLKILDGATVKTIQAKNGYYEFTQMLPGNYEILIDTDVFCWEKSNHQILVNSERAVIPPFKQTGFSVTFISSHDTAVEFFDPVKSKKIALTLPLRSTRHCVSSPGEYKFIPKSCHVYAQEIYTWNTNNPIPIILSSNEHRYRGSIITNTIASENIKMKIVTVDSESKTSIIGPLKYTSIGDNKYKYTFKFNTTVDTTYILTPISDYLLFNPPKFKIIGSNDCQNDVILFIGELGKIISGKISPPLDGVTVKIYRQDNQVPIYTLITQKDGSYKVGPLDGKFEYNVTAEKNGYSINGPDLNGIFFAHKLAEIIVEVIDEINSSPLQGVLLSLSGGNSYRQNSITTENGQMTFNSLSPGEYYLRPMMKEYRFDPPSKMISVSEGATMKVTLSGNRVAFSAYGKVTSLNGDGEPGLIIEAQGQNDCSNLQEESTTEDNGNFRIRGLQPKCMYIVRLKNNDNSNNHIQRISPNSIAVQATEDIFQLRFIAFHPISRTDISVHIHSNQMEHYKTLKVKLCNEEQPDSPVHIIKIDPQQAAKMTHTNPGFLLHFPSILLNGKKYFIQLESTLSSSMYKYKTIPTYFQANESFKAVYLKFHAERKIDQADMNQISILVLPLIILLPLAFLNRDKLFNWLNIIVDNWSKPVITSKTQSPIIPIDPRADDIIVEQIMNINKRKTKPRKT